MKINKLKNKEKKKDILSTWDSEEASGTDMHLFTPFYFIFFFNNFLRIRKKNLLTI